MPDDPKYAFHVAIAASSTRIHPVVVTCSPQGSCTLVMRMTGIIRTRVRTRSVVCSYLGPREPNRYCSASPDYSENTIKLHGLHRHSLVVLESLRHCYLNCQTAVDSAGIKPELIDREPHAVSPPSINGVGGDEMNVHP